MTPLLYMYTLGHQFVPPSIHAGGLRYHGAAPLVAHLYEQGLIEARAVPQRSVFEAAVLFARTAGILPAPESAHAVRAAVDEALRAKEEGRERTILFGLRGHGPSDVSAFDAYVAGVLQSHEVPQEAIDAALGQLPAVNSSGVGRRRRHGKGASSAPLFA